VERQYSPIICKICSKTVFHKGSGTLYCKECAIEVIKEKSKKRGAIWSAKNIVKLREYKRWQQKRLREKNGKILDERSRAYKKKYPERQRAVNALNQKVTSGKIIRPKICEACGCSGKIVGHHKDYSKPLDVMWLCYPCHKKEHKLINYQTGGKEND